jgi:hypothetical protein
MPVDKSESERVLNERFVRRINEYWQERGIFANARVEKREVPVYTRYVTKTRKCGDGVKRSYKVMITLDEPDVISSWEIVSDFGTMVAWVPPASKPRGRAA